MAKMQDMLAGLDDIVSASSLYTSLVVISLLLTCLQLLKNLDFLPRLGIITKTITGAATDLAFFFLLYIMVNVIYALLGNIIFGETEKDFATVSESFLTCQLILLGIYEPQDLLEHAVMQQLAMLFYWTYLLINFFVLLNALLGEFEVSTLQRCLSRLGGRSTQANRSPQTTCDAMAR